jgi:hypothetical protein
MNKHLLLLILTAVAILVPFTNRAFFIDDWYHYTIADQIIKDPLRPYSFTGYEVSGPMQGWEKGKLPWMVNPPGMHYSVALLMKIVGVTDQNVTDRAWRLRLLFFIFPVLSVVFMYYISTRFVNKPVYATLLFMFTPAFWVTSTGLLIDTVLLTFYLASILTFIKSCETDNRLWPILCGTCVALTFMSKYTGLSVVPVIGIYLIINHDTVFGGSRKLWRFGWILLIPLAVFIGWYWLNVRIYGSSHFFSALKVDVVRSGNLWIKILTLLIFFSGSLMFPVTALFLVNKTKKFVYFVAVGTAGLMTVFMLPDVGGFTLVQSIMNTVFILTTMTFLYIIISRFFVPAESADKRYLFSVCWVILLFLMMIKTMSWLAVRCFLIFLPPAVFLFIYMAEYHNLKKPVMYLVLGLTFVTGFVITYTDYVQAEVCRLIRKDLVNYQMAGPAGKKYFYGNSFVGYFRYLSEIGWSPAMTGTKLVRGDVLLVSSISFPVSKSGLPVLDRCTLENIFDYKTFLPVRVMSIDDCAGLYCSFFGNLPFVFSTKPVERFYLYKIG